MGLHLKKFYPLLGTAFIFALIYLVSQSIPEENFRSFLNQAGIWGPLLFILITLLTFVIAPLSGTPLLFAGFYAFGEKVVFLTMGAAFFSFIINFWIARRWGRPMVERFVGGRNLDKIDKLTGNYGLAMLALLRIFLGSSQDFVSYAAGLTSLNFLPYLIISLLAAFPGTILWYIIALQIESPFAFTAISLLMTFTLSAIFVLAALVNRKWRHG